MTVKSIARLTLSGAMGLSLVIGLSAQAAYAQTYRAVAANFVGAAGDCGTGYPAGHRIVTSAWQNGFGLPDNAGTHPQGGTQKHEGLLLSKNGLTSDCSSATAEITIAGAAATVDINTLGFDYRNGTSCGSGAPRFNVYTTTGIFFYGCLAGTSAPAPQNPAEWTRVTFSGLAHTLVTGVEIVFDEGTDTALPGAPAGPGLVSLDNILINTTFIRRKAGNAFTP